MKAINLSAYEVAKRAGISHSILSRAASRGNCEQKTIEAVSAVLVQEEARLRTVLGLDVAAEQGRV